MAVKYKRVLIKLSGEALAGDDKFGVNPDVAKETARQIKEISDLGVQVAIVVAEEISSEDARERASTELQLTIWACWQQS